MCWEGAHLAYGVPLGVAGLLVWVVGVPVAAYLLIFDERKRLHSRAIREKLGFFYNGYKSNSACWELFILLKKLAIAASAIFLAGASGIMQSLFLFTLLLVEVVLLLKLRPFIERRFNILVVISTMALVITIYCGLFYFSSRVQSNASFTSGNNCELSLI